METEIKDILKLVDLDEEEEKARELVHNYFLTKEILKRSSEVNSFFHKSPGECSPTSSGNILCDLASDQEKIWLNYIDKLEKEHKEEIKKLNKEWEKRFISIENIYRKNLGLEELKEGEYYK